MHIKALPLALCAGLLGTAPAFAAVTVTNQDSKPHTVVINTGPGTKSKQEQVAAGASIKADCPNKCGFRDLVFGTSREAGGDAKLVIDKQGELHFAGGQGDLEMPNGKN